MSASQQQVLDKLFKILSKDRYYLISQFDKLKNQPDSSEYKKLISKIDKSHEAYLLREQAVPVKIEIASELPVGDKADEIEKVIAENQVVILAGETGSGKTTQLPKICLKLGRGVAGMIGHTQPRRLAARAVATRVAEELGTPLGQQVGFQVRFSDQTADNTLVKMMTDGILLAEIQHDRYLSKYDTIIIDEAHERSLNIDFLLGILRTLLPKRPDLKIIITSATIDVDRFSKHFNDAPIISVSGRTYPVETIYRPLGVDSEESDGKYDLDVSQGILSAVEEIIELERKGETPSKGGDVLVFLPGEREIRETAELIRRASLPLFEVLPLYARLSAAEQQRVFAPHGGRRIVLATNVAETSLTVPGIHYVIDPGLVRISRYSYKSKVQRLPIEAISQASANQRAGRCGRIAPGMCIRLYSEDDFITRDEFTDPEILRTNLASVILQMLQMGIHDIEKFPFVDMPDSRFIKDGFTLLKELNAVSEKGRLTATGRQLAKLPVDPRLARMLLEAEKQKSLSEVLIIVSALAVQDPRERPQEKRAQADQAHAVDKDRESDFISYLNLWNRYEEQRQELSQNQLRKFCKKNFLNYMRMREWRDLHRQLHLAAKDLKFTENKNEASYQSIHQSLLAGLLSHIANHKEDRTFVAARGRHCVIHPSTGVKKKQPKWIASAELVETTQLFARSIAIIQSEWIESLSAHLVKKQYFEPHWEKKRAQVVAFEQVTLYGLTIVNRRKVHFGKIDPIQAREIFIRSGLVEQQYASNARFYQKNAQLISKIENLEAKARRKDILVDDETLFEFYDSKIPPEIVNGNGFEAWRKQAEQKDPDILLLTEEKLKQRNPDEITHNAYPESLSWNGIQFPMRYHFEPGAKDDGVTLRVPAAALNQLSENRLQWLVPGLLKEKCIALVKSLPKQLRKNFVPVPNFIEGALPDIIHSDDKSLTEVLAHKLLRMTGVRIPEDAWDLTVLDDHLKMNIEVVNSKGKVLRQGRELSKLLTDTPEEETRAAPEVLESEERTVVFTDWSFPELPKEQWVSQAGIKMKHFPALVETVDDTGIKGVSIQLFDSPDQANHEHRNGVVRLLRNGLKVQEQHIGKLIRQHKQLGLLYAPIGKIEELIEDLTRAAFFQCFLPFTAEVPRSHKELEVLREQHRAELVSVAERLINYLTESLKRRLGISKKIKNKKASLVMAFIYADINGQLEALFYPGFIKQVEEKWLKNYSRYLEAIEMRLDRSSGVPANEQLIIDELNGYAQRYTQKKKQMETERRYSEDLELFRWMIEEYRVSLFAQKLGTEMSISAKRLEKQWELVK